VSGLGDGEPTYKRDSLSGESLTCRYARKRLLTCSFTTGDYGRFRGGSDQAGIPLESEPYVGGMEQPPADLWAEAMKVAPPGSDFLRELRASQGDVEGRGVYTSGESIWRPTDIAARYGYRWDEGERRFRRSWASRKRVVVGALLGLGAFGLNLFGSTVGTALANGAAIAMAYVALVSVPRH
jgi:hypothetical protein